MNSVSPSRDIELAFLNLHEKLEQIGNISNFKQAHKLLKNTAAKVDQSAKKGCFSVTYKRELPKNSYPKFLKALKIKARDATGIVPSIDGCELKNPKPMGFVRAIKIGQKEALQRVWECQKQNSFKIIFRTEGLKFIATNEIAKDRGKVFFTARYLLDEHPKYTSPVWFLQYVMEPTFKNLSELSSNPKLTERSRSFPY
ncbi:MAG: hypothetical protein V4487_06280 [Chlamydiota bacterium]